MKCFQRVLSTGRGFKISIKNHSLKNFNFHTEENKREISVTQRQAFCGFIIINLLVSIITTSLSTDTVNKNTPYGPWNVMRAYRRKTDVIQMIHCVDFTHRNKRICKDMKNSLIGMTCQLTSLHWLKNWSAKWCPLGVIRA